MLTLKTVEWNLQTLYFAEYLYFVLREQLKQKQCLLLFQLYLRGL